jgi:WD40 repeat protein/serine/threonine protein kinase
MVPLKGMQGDMSEHILVDETLISRLPLPLAQLARRVPNAKTPLERHLAAYLLWEAGLKLLASAAIVEYAERQDPDPALAERLKNLARPSVGHWWEFVRRLVPVLAEGGDDGFRDVRDLVLGRTRDDLPRAAGLDAALQGALGGPGAARSTVRLTELFERMVTYRKREIGHGAPGQRPPSYYDRMARALMAGLSQVFDRLDVLAGRQLIYVDDVRRLASGDWLVDRYELIGEAAKRIESMTVADAQSATLPRPQRVYLERRAGGLVTSRSLHPLVCYQLDSGKVFFLNGRSGKQQAEYLCYDDGDLLRMDLNADHRSLLAEVLGRPVDSELADAWAAASTAEDAPEELHPARLPERAVGEFELLSRLGRGGMGVVYRAWQPSLCRQVAVKCMLRSGDPKAEARFAREIRALGRVEHPNLVKVFTSGSEGDQWFYAMELVEGAELSGICEQLAGRDASAVDESSWREALSSAYAKARSSETPLSQLGRGAPSPPDDDVPHPESSGATEVHLPAPGGRGYVRHVVGLLERIADAAHTLHEAGVVHRDIKPGNVMITADGQTPVLMDLGLAQIADETEGRITHTRQFIGTLRYASPEQILAAGSVDRRSDVYSLGATLWELLTLRPLFGATDQTPSPDLMLDIQSRTPESLRRYNPQVPRDLEACVLKCLEKDRARRYTTAADLAADLNRFLRGEPVAAQPPSLGYLASKFVKRHKLPLAAAAAVLLTLIAGTGFAFYRIDKERKDALSARNNEAAAKVEAQDLAREASALAGKNSALAEQEAEARRNVVRQLGLARLTAFDIQLDRAGKLLSTDPGAAVRMLADEDQCPPDLRDFAWGHLMARARRVKWVIRPDASPIHRVAFLPDAFVFATAGADGTVRLWNGAGSSHQAMTAFSGHDGDVWSVTIAPDARTAASAGRDGTIRVWDLVKGVAGAVLRGHEGDVNDVAFSPGGTALASGGRDGTVRVWDMGRGAPIATLRSGGEPIFCVAFGPDGGTLASSGADQIVRIWDAVRIVPDPPAPKIEAVEPEGFHTPPPAPPPVIHDWNMKDPHERLTITVDGAPASSLAFAPDGLMLAGGCVDRVVRVWESIKGHEEARLTGHGGPVTAVAFSLDGVTLASCGAAGIKLWETEGWRETSVVRAPGDEVPTALAFSVDSGTLAVGDQSGVVSVWDVPDRRMRRWFSGHKKILQPAVYSPDGRLLAASQSDGKIRLWDAATGAPVRSLAGHAQFVNEVAFSSDGKTLASVSDDGTAKTWDVVTGREKAVMAPTGSPADHRSRALTVAYAPDRTTLAVAGDSGQIHLFDLATGRERLSFPKVPPAIATPEPPPRESTSPKPAPVPARSGRKLPADDPAAALAAAVAEAEKIYLAQMTEQVVKRIRESRDSRDGALTILRSAQNMIRSAEQLDEAARNRLDKDIRSEMAQADRLRVIRSLAYAPDGRKLVSADARGLIRVWDTATGEEVVTAGSQPGGTDRVAYSPDGRFIASSGSALELVVWDATGKGERLRLAGRPGAPPSFSFAPDGQAFAYQAVDSVRVIHIETRQTLAVFSDPGLVWGLAFAPDGTALVGSDSESLRAWDLTPEPEQTSLFGHRSEVRSVAVSTDGTIASGDVDGRILLWTPSGGLAAELTGESDPRSNNFMMDRVDSLSFSPSGRLVASRTDSGLITLWDVITGRARVSLGRFADAPPGKDQPSYIGRPARSTLAFSADGSFFAATSGVGKVSVWDTRTWRELILDGPKALPLALSFGVDAKTIVAAFDSGEISRWEIETHKHNKLPSVGATSVGAISPDGTTLAVVGRPVEEVVAAADRPADGRKETVPAISVLDLATGRLVVEIKDIAANAQSLAFSSDGRRIAATGWSGGVTVWDAASGEKTVALGIAPLTGRVSGVAFAPDGSKIVTAGPQSAAYSWDAANGEQRASFEGHTAPVTAVSRWRRQGRTGRPGSGTFRPGPTSPRSLRTTHRCWGWLSRPTASLWPPAGTTGKSCSGTLRPARYVARSSVRWASPNRKPWRTRPTA